LAPIPATGVTLWIASPMSVTRFGAHSGSSGMVCNEIARSSAPSRLATRPFHLKQSRP
jgi:hypothetical protein